MHITYNLPHVFSPVSSPDDDAHALRALLDCLIDLNLGFLRRYPVKSLYQSGVVYGRTVLWEPIPALYARGYGDCKSLTAAYIAEKHLQGVELSPVFRWVKQPDGVKNFHILVMGPNGFEDPSKVLGMGANELSYFYQGAAR